VVDHEVGGHQRIDPAGVLAGSLHGGAHRGQVDDGGHSGEILEEHPGWLEGDLGVFGRRIGPAGQGVQTRLGPSSGINLAQQAFEQDLHRHRQPRRVGHARAGQLLERVIVEVTSGQPLADRHPRPISLDPNPSSN